MMLELPKTMSFAEAPSRAKRLIQEGDTVISTVRPGRRSMFYVKQSDPDWVVSTGFAVLRPYRENIEPRYLYACVFDRRFTEFLVKREKGAAYPAVLPEDIADAVINLPPRTARYRPHPRHAGRQDRAAVLNNVISHHHDC